MKGYIISSHILLSILLIGATVAYQHWFNRKDKISKLLKNYIVHIIVVIILYSLISPIILYFFGVFKEGRALYNSDILGYYGALIGGGVTVLGIYWTFKYESEKSKEEREYERQKAKEEIKQEYEKLKEERRKNSLPILRFNFISESKTPDEDSEYDILLRKCIDKKDNTKIVHILVKYNMWISNIGLQPAILSSISLLSDDDRVLQEDKPNLDLSNLLISNNPKDLEYKINLTIIFTFQEYDNYNLQEIPEEKDYNRGDYLLVVFTDLYSNEYQYKIPIIDKQIGKEHYLLLKNEEIPVLPLEME